MASRAIISRRGGNTILSKSLLRKQLLLTSRWQSSLASAQVVDKHHDRLEIEKEQAVLPVPKELKFDNAKEAFRSKTTFEIARALAVFRLCSIDFLVEKNQEIMKLSQKLMGKKLFRKVMKSTFYGHFVAGEDKDDIKPTIHNLNKYGVGAILDYSVEEDLSEEETKTAMGDTKQEPEFVSDIADDHGRFKPHEEFADRRKGVFSARTYFYSGEPECDARLETFMECVDAASGASSDGFAAIKVTALGRPQLLLKVSEILHQTQAFFDQLTMDSAIKNKIGYGLAKNRFFDGLERLGVDISQEEADRIFDLIDTDNSGDIDVIEWHEYLTPQLQLSKLFKAHPVGDEETGQPLITLLTPDELRQVENMRGRLHQLGEHARNKNVRLMIDAEQSYFQPAIRRFTVDLQREFNKSFPLVLNTYQCYLKSAHRDAQVDMELARREGFKFGAKLVRGAYMEQERLRAQSLGYDDPIHPSYAATSECYNQTLNDILEECRRGDANVMVASHNEDSVRFAVKRMYELGISPEDKKVFFGQLLGMSDPLSFTLGQAGYSVYKYVPYGPVEDVLPYLSRRAMENRGLLKGILKERRMLWKEFTRRLRERQLFGHATM
ncbi:proline dehydrogenase 1, mitochondrial [Nematostella vectensis]|uniref:proline dehydrogenase 1, mitochondrial n=1 Tax=Nematostella vectensis TaxID=45351 RepID=UPI0020775C35|nr:proline dehydrogenase 1, mitochondrial [Nematostella vectensis]